MLTNRFFELKNILAGVVALTVFAAVMTLAKVPPFDAFEFSLNPFEEGTVRQEGVQESPFPELFSVKPDAMPDEVAVAALEQLKKADISGGLSLRNADKLSLSESYFSEASKSYPVKWLLDNKSFAVVTKRAQDSVSAHVRIALYDVKSTPRSFTFVLRQSKERVWKIEQVLYEP
jgi:hypothetical protein